MERYDPQAIEAKWQKVWADERSFHVPNPDAGRARARRSPQVVRRRDAARIPSGDLHMGHTLNYTIGDVITHLRRRKGMQVLRPMGYDAFGLPAENAAIKEGGHPRTVTERNIVAIREQMHRMGWAIDWAREISTHDPAYYRWTQWLFLRFYERGLAYRKEAPVKWCPNDQTVLANEQVIDGRCERCGAEVEAKNLTQWFFRITDYADELLDEMDAARGLAGARPHDAAQLDRPLARAPASSSASKGAGRSFPVFTTRPDTLFGATFFVLAPENPLVTQLVAGSEHETEVLDYVRQTAARSEVEREEKEKDGVFTGRFAVNPVNGESIPIWVADYVLMGYGTGAIMAVPAHDERDYAFAERYGLEIRPVVVPEGERAAGGRSVLGPHGRTRCSSTRARSTGSRAPRPRSGSSPGSPSAASARRRSATGCATGSSRGSATGAVRSRSSTAPPAARSPFRTTSCPSLLPDITEVAPKGRSPLAAAEDWVNTTCPTCGGPALRETDTMDTFVDSSWYFIRYTDPVERRSCRSIARSPTTGCRSTSTSAASSTRCSTCSTRGSSPR